MVDLVMRNPHAICAPRGVKVLYGAMVLLFLALATHAATNVGGDGLDPLFQKWINDVVPIGCALVCTARAWRVREERLAWLLVGLGIAFWAVGNVYYSLYVIDVVPLPVPSVADGLWLAQYPVSLVAVLLLMRSRLSGMGVHVWLDGAIAGLALAGVSAAIVLPSVLGASGGNSIAEVLTNLAYPICDMVLLGSLVGALAARQWRLGRMWTSLSLGFVAFIVTDGLFLVQSAQGTYVVGTIVDSGWLLGGLLMAFAAWQPIEQPLLTARRQGLSALLMPSLFGSVALFLLIWDHFERLTVSALVLASASVAVVLARMAFAFGENLRMLARLRQEAESLALKNEQLLEVEGLREDLRQSQKMEALGQLAGGVAHDFNNLLTVVSGYTALLRPKVAGDPSAGGQLDAIATATERATDLTRQLLTFSSRQGVEASDLDLNEVVLETEAMIASTLGNDVRLVAELSEARPVARADRGRISQVLVNLVLNARDSMPGGGTILISTAGPAFEPVDAGAGDRDGFVTLTVADTGTGMDEATQGRIFEPFFTTKGKHQGTGLGLATVYGIVEGAGGFLEVDSMLGVGSTFKISLPAAVGQIAAQAVSSAAPSTTPSCQKVLLVEDEPAVRDLVVQQLERLGHIVTATPTPAQAVALFESREGDFDLVVTDVVMPRMSGWELVERLREHRADLPVVLISGYAGGAVGTSDVVGPTAFLEKPFTLEALAAKVKAVTPREQLLVR
jgi:signal transduction histidine kinase/ActR/RegA family two-component response regulator